MDGLTIGAPDRRQGRDTEQVPGSEQCAFASLYDANLFIKSSNLESGKRVDFDVKNMQESLYQYKGTHGIARVFYFHMSGDPKSWFCFLRNLVAG